ncbi:MAG: DUF1641 domain-containing protein [Acidimicrobiales bacterium]
MAEHGVVVRDQVELDRLIDRLSEPQVVASLNLLLDNVELIAVMVSGMDGLARKGEVIGDTLAEVLYEVRAAGRATGLDLRETSGQLATLIPTLADASPTINRILESPIVQPEPIEVLSNAAESLVEGLQTAQANQTKAGLRGLYKASKDEDVQRGFGFLIEVAKVFGRHLASTKPTAV